MFEQYFVQENTNVKLSMQKCQPLTLTYTIPLGGLDIVLNIYWLENLGTLTMTFDKIFIKIKVERNIN